jgi:hypothetical protein
MGAWDLRYVEVQAIKHMDNDEDIGAAEELRISFFNRAVCVCNADGAISTMNTCAESSECFLVP